MKNTTTLLKVVVGSQAHGLATPDSDYDYRGVFTYPTSDLLGLNPPQDQTSWIEGNEDDTSWELWKFLKMATKCNPTVLEVFLAPSVVTTVYGDQLRALFPYCWNSNDVHNAFVGYGLNQRKKFLENKDKRSPKYAVAYLRTLYQAEELLTTGTFSVNMEHTPIYETLVRWKSGKFRLGEVIDMTNLYEQRVHIAYDTKPKQETNIKPINDFLLEVRRAQW